MPSQEMLQRIANDPHSSDVERGEALASLSRTGIQITQPTSQDREDAELESWFAVGPRRSRDEILSAHDALSPLSKELAADIDYGRMAVVRDGAAERLTALIARTGSERIRRVASEALANLNLYARKASAQ